MSTPTQCPKCGTQKANPYPWFKCFSVFESDGEFVESIDCVRSQRGQLQTKYNQLIEVNAGLVSQLEYSELHVEELQTKLTECQEALKLARGLAPKVK